MSRLAAALLLSLTFATAHAQTITASSTVMEFAPLPVPGESAPQLLTLTNHSTSPVQLAVTGTGLGFGTYAPSCGGSIAPGSTCTVAVQFELFGGNPLGAYRAQLNVDTSANDFAVPLYGFAYTRDVLPGIRNLIDSVKRTTLPSATRSRLLDQLSKAYRLAGDGHSCNDASARKLLARFAQSIEQEAAAGRLADWLAIGLIYQAQVASEGIGRTG